MIPAEKQTVTRFSVRRHKKLVWALCALFVAAAVTGGFFAEKYWPYRYRNVKPLLQQVFASKVTISHYRRTYFPHPGFVAKELTLRRNLSPGSAPIGSARDLVVQGTWTDLLLLRKRVMLVDIVGLHLVIPPMGSSELQKDFPVGSSADFAGPSMSVQELHVHRAVLDIMRTDGSRYSYAIKEAIIRNLRMGQPISYFLDMRNSAPLAGHIVARGSFGPLIPKNLGATPLSGKFTFGPANLNQVGELHGTMSGKGHFSGRLTSIEGYATANVTDFAVSDGRPAAVSGSLQCTVNGLNADVVLHTMAVKTGETTIHAGGDMVGWPKVIDMDLTVAKGRAQDVLRPFLHDSSPITGVVWLKSHAHLAPAGPGTAFLKRLTMEGHFDVPDERVTIPSTEKMLSQFSERAQGEKQDDDADVLSSLEGPATIRNGLVSTRGLMFEVPGAKAKLHGWYNLSSGAVHLDGTMKMKSDISHAETGFKSLLLKPLAPFFKKKKAGAVVPIAITGKPNHYKVSSNFLHQK
ncbi:MAG: AsmA-like C-terminal region-containing protein [Acidobacteriaceae bacterium]